MNRPRQSGMGRNDREGNPVFDDFEKYIQECTSGKMVSLSKTKKSFEQNET